MGLGIREWLIIGGVALVLAVLVDGFRRMRSERRNNIKMSIGIGGGFPDDVEPFDTELPNGGARIIRRQEPHMAEFALDDSMTADLGNTSDPYQAPVSTTEQQEQPWLNEPELPAAAKVQNEDIDAYAMVERQIIVLHVKSKDDDGFKGNDLLQILLACDLRYADTKVLQRYEQSGGKGACQFSVANMIEPGTFDIDAMNNFSTPGVTFFMTVPGPADVLQAFDCMLETAQCLAKNLNGELLNEEHKEASIQELGAIRAQVERRAQLVQEADLA